MWREICLVWLLIVSAVAIRVPVDNKDEGSTTVEVNGTSTTPDAPRSTPNASTYESEESKIDGYLVPPSSHPSAEDKQDLIPTYLLPPTQEKQEDFYSLPVNTGQQSDWYPIQQSALQNNPNILAQSFPQNKPELLSQNSGVSHSLPQSQSFLLPHVGQQEAIPIIMLEEIPPQFRAEHTRSAKSQQFQQQFEIPVPSRHLEPPLESAENHYILPTPASELELPYEEQRQPFNAPLEEEYDQPFVRPNQDFNPQLSKNTPVNFHLKPGKPTLSLHLTPPKLSQHKNPTKLYPKKYSRFQPVPIPISQFVEESSGEVPKAKPVRMFNPATGDSEYSMPVDKETYLYEKVKQKQKLRKEKGAQQPLTPVPELTHGSAPAEQEASETHFRYPGRNVYPAPLRQAPPTPPPRAHPAEAPPKPPPAGDRTEFRMHGMKGPHSYQFGYDTGKGKNRQFRFEERDNDGHVRGHYGYMDKHGKMRVVNYDADPQLGFRAEPPVESDP